MNDINSPKKSSNLTLFVISFFSLAVAIAALVLIALMWQESNSLRDSLAISKNANETLQTSIQDLKSNLNDTQQNVTQLMRSAGNEQQQNMLSQIAYLINLANLQLTISHDSTSALSTLSLAQEKLEAMNDPRLFALTKTLAQDLLILKATPTVNLTELITDIDLLNTAIANSSFTPNEKDLKIALEKQSTMAATLSSDTVKQKWYQRLWCYLSRFKELVIISHRTTNLNPILDATQKSLIKSALQAKLLLAEYAVIQHDNAAYQHNLTVVQKSIETYYANSMNRADLLSKLNTLQKKNIGEKIPTINDSISVLNETLNKSSTGAGV